MYIRLRMCIMWRNDISFPIHDVCASIFLNYEVGSFCLHSLEFLVFETKYINIFIYINIWALKEERTKNEKCKQNEQTYNDIRFSTKLKER